MANNSTETLLKTDDQKEVTEVMTFLGELKPDEKKDFLVFIQGVRFARGMKKMAG